MANKKAKKEEKEERKVSKQEKQMFSLQFRAHDKYGNPVVWPTCS